MNILVPTDFSPLSIEALAFAATITESTHSNLTAVYFFDLPMLPETTFGIQPKPSNPVLETELKARATREWKEIETQNPSLRHTEFVAAHGRPAAGLRDFIRARHADLIVISRQQADEKNSLEWRTTGAGIMRESPVPVIILPGNIQVKEIKDILFPNDLKSNQHALINKVKELQDIFKAKLHLLFVNTPDHFFSDDEMSEKLRAFASSHYLTNYNIHVRNDTSAHHGILGFAKENKFQMVAMGTHGRSGLPLLFQGSVATSVYQRIETAFWAYNFTLQHH